MTLPRERCACNRPPQQSAAQTETPPGKLRGQMGRFPACPWPPGFSPGSQKGSPSWLLNVPLVTVEKENANQAENRKLPPFPERQWVSGHEFSREVLPPHGLRSFTRSEKQVSRKVELQKMLSLQAAEFFLRSRAAPSGQSLLHRRETRPHGLRSRALRMRTHPAGGRPSHLPGLLSPAPPPPSDTHVYTRVHTCNVCLPPEALCPSPHIFLTPPIAFLMLLQALSVSDVICSYKGPGFLEAWMILGWADSTVVPWSKASLTCDQLRSSRWSSWLSLTWAVVVAQHRVAVPASLSYHGGKAPQVIARRGVILVRHSGCGFNTHVQSVT